ncbi:hypothetical protein ACPV4U_12055 [Vibrio alginolyticus]
MNITILYGEIKNIRDNKSLPVLQSYSVSIALAIIDSGSNIMIEIEQPNQ